jgi:hypothetical protein
MLGLSFLKTAKYKKFEFNPRYYDERKERREELIRQLEEEDQFKKSGIAGEYKSRLKSGYLTNYRRKVQRKEGNSSMIRIAIIIVVLMAIFYWLLR